MKVISNKLKKFDLFGQPISLKFNNKGSEHRTIIGSIFSIVGMTLWLSYFVILIRRMVLKDADDFNSMIIP
jgi:hypothetical protein